MLLPFSHSHNSEQVSAYTKPLHFPAPQWCCFICNFICNEYQLFCRWLRSHVHNSEAYGTYRGHNTLLRASPCIQDAITMLMLTQQLWEHFFRNNLPQHVCVTRVCYIHVMRTCVHACVDHQRSAPGGIRYFQQCLPADNGAHSVWVSGSFLWPTHTHRFSLPSFSMSTPSSLFLSLNSLRWLVELGGCYTVWIIEEKQRKKEGVRRVNWPIALHPEPASWRNSRLTLHSRASTRSGV